MSERDTYPAGVPCWVDIAVPDPDAAMAFYGELFGWEFTDPGAMPDGGRYHVARLRGRDIAGVGSEPATGTPGGPAWTTYISVDSADEATASVKDAGGRAVAEPFDVHPAGRMAVLADPEGAVFCVWEPRDRNGAQLVNEPSAWSMSALNASDPEAAKRFYRTVFGWSAEAFEFGGAVVTLLRLDGYVGGEPEQPVPRDLVATMLPADDDATADHWSVDFWIEDVHAAVERAGQGGGTVIAPPYEIPGAPMKEAVVADPDGAVLSLTQLVVPGS